MKVLVTGATGFLGSHIVKALLKDVHQVIILKRSFSDARRIVKVLPLIAAYDLDQCELEEPFKYHGKIDAVIHTATCYGRNGERESHVFEVNTAFPLRLLEVAALFNTDTFFNTDTILYKYLNSYALSKKHFLEWGKQFANLGKIRFVNIKLEHIYGPGDDDSKFTTHVIKSCLRNVPELKLTAGEQKRDFIYIDDVVSAYCLLLQIAHEQPSLFQDYGLGSGKATSIREFVETVHRLTQSKTVLKFGALAYRQHEIMESKANVEPLKTLGWDSKVSLEEGIQAVIREEGRR
jgi:nucleoside-diphosphate-sugar epimerase